MIAKIKRAIFIIFSIFAIVTNAPVWAAETINLPDSLLIGDNDGIHVNSNGEYYLINEAVTPGEVIKKNIVIQNLEVPKTSLESGIPYIIYMTMEPVSSNGPVELLDTHLKIIKDSAVLYNGDLRGNGEYGMNARLNSLYLGRYSPGDRGQLIIELTIKDDVSPEIWNSQVSDAVFRWKFTAERDLKTPIPKTGVLINIVVFVFAAAFIILAIMCSVKKFKTAKKDNADKSKKRKQEC